jgi:rubrerythrin
MRHIKGTRTEQNLLKAFAGESQARNRYTFFAKRARKEGYEQIAAIFNEIAAQEQEHAEIFFKLLEGGKATISDATYPAGRIASTYENLLAAAEGEREEWDTLYPTFAVVAEQEGLHEVASVFRLISTIEVEHEGRFLALAKRMTDGKFFHRDKEVWWRCRNCGFVCRATDAPLYCPACQHPQGYFEEKH